MSTLFDIGPGTWVCEPKTTIQRNATESKDTVI